MAQDLQFIDDLPGIETFGRSTITAERVAAMVTNKGKWLVWPSKSSSGTVKKSLEAFDGTFEVASRKVDDEYQVYARCVTPALDAGPPPASMHTCPTCTEPLIAEGVSQADLTAALAAHYRENPECKQAAVRRSRGK